MKFQWPKRVLKSESALSLIFCLIFSFSADAAENSKLRVLYVGPDPASQPNVPTLPHNGSPRDLTGKDRERFAELRTERPEAFRSLLSKHFDNFKIIVAEDYRVELSEQFDVTIFDAQPGGETKKQPDGWEKRIRLPDNFSHPAMMIGEVGPFTIGKFGNDFLLDHL